MTPGRPGRIMIGPIPAPRRDQGVGAALLRDDAARLRATGCATLWCDARVTAQGVTTGRGSKGPAWPTAS